MRLSRILFATPRLTEGEEGSFLKKRGKGRKKGREARNGIHLPYTISNYPLSWRAKAGSLIRGGEKKGERS